MSSGVNEDEVEARTGGGGGGATTVVAALEILVVLNGVGMLVCAEVTVEPLSVRERIRKGFGRGGAPFIVQLLWWLLLLPAKGLVLVWKSHWATRPERGGVRYMALSSEVLAVVAVVWGRGSTGVLGRCV